MFLRTIRGSIPLLCFDVASLCASADSRKSSRNADVSLLMSGARVQ